LSPARVASEGHFELVAATELVETNQRGRDERVGRVGEVAVDRTPEETAIPGSIEPAGDVAFGRDRDVGRPLEHRLRRATLLSTTTGNTTATEPVAATTPVATERAAISVCCLALLGARASLGPIVARTPIGATFAATTTAATFAATTRALMATPPVRAFWAVRPVVTLVLVVRSGREFLAILTIGAIEALDAFKTFGEVFGRQWWRNGLANWLAPHLNSRRFAARGFDSWLLNRWRGITAGSTSTRRSFTARRTGRARGSGFVLCSL